MTAGTLPVRRVSLRPMRWPVLGGAVLLAACGTARLDLRQYPTHEALYEAAKRAYRQGDCDRAEHGFQQLIAVLPPRDDRVAEARYYVAECLFTRHQRLEAAREFRRVTDEFPRHALAPDALLRAGDAYAAEWNDPELDPTQGEAALATYQELLQRFGSSPAAGRARLRIAALNDKFAAKTYKTGQFYLRSRAYDSAIIYFKDVVARYPESSYAAPALVRLVDIYKRIGYAEERQELCQYLRQYYPAAVSEASPFCSELGAGS